MHKNSFEQNKDNNDDCTRVGGCTCNLCGAGSNIDSTPSSSPPVPDVSNTLVDGIEFETN